MSKHCFGVRVSQLLSDYHDKEWGVPVHDDSRLFEILCLEVSQAGLSWELILKKREGYRNQFHQFNPNLVVRMTDGELEQILSSDSIVRHRRKIFSIRSNAKTFLEIQEQFQTFDAYVWRYVDNHPILNRWKHKEHVPCSSKISEQLAKDLKKRGMVFIGSTIIYSFMQAAGLVNDHLIDCPFYLGRAETPTYF